MRVYDGEVAAQVVVGRSAESHRTIPDPLISRRHLKFARDGDRWTVTDLVRHGAIHLDDLPRQPRG